MDEAFAQLEAAARKSLPKLDSARLEHAYVFAKEAHGDQIRKSGEPYITHPLAAALELAHLRVDEDTLVACLLHDVPEDTERTLADIRVAFGEDVASLVDGVTKLSKVHYKNDMEQHQIESLRKMFLVMAQDLRVVLIKLADRLHNMQTLYWVNPEKRVRIARETLEIYAPLADRLGIGQFKWQLEDLCFKYLFPLEEAALREELSEGQAERESYIERVRQILERELGTAGVAQFEVSGRTKHLYSIFQKMKQEGKTLDEVFDIFALRAVVPTVKDCYTVLGIVHDLWKPKPGRFKDYIAVPKPNGYQSLHTTVFCIGGRLTEFQIRTTEMHQEAEFGVPAHWFYNQMKGSKTRIPRTAPQDEWTNRIMELQESARDSREFVESVKLDVFNDRIFIFTPKGDVKDLTIGAIALDFAYAIHSDIGHRTVGAKINGTIAPLSTRLHTGDVIEIITTKVPNPKRDWISMVKTSQAKTKIRSWFKSQNRDKNVETGRALLNRALEQAGREKVEKVSAERINTAAAALNVRTLEDLLAGIGEGTFSPLQILKKLFRPEELLTEITPVRARPAAPGVARIYIQGSGDIDLNLAKCCLPKQDEKIVGYITKSKMITVHALSCGSLKALDPHRLIHASWSAPTDTRRYRVDVRIIAKPAPSLTRDILLSVSNADVTLSRLETETEDGMMSFLVAVEVTNVDALVRLFDALERIPGVERVLRQTGATA